MMATTATFTNNTKFGLNQQTTNEFEIFRLCENCIVSAIKREELFKKLTVTEQLPNLTVITRIEYFGAVKKLCYKTV